MTDDAVLAIGSHRNNAELIAACARLGYLTDDGRACAEGLEP